MITKGNFTETKERIKKFVQEGDFSNPFVLAGWSGIGKTALVTQIDKELGLDKTYVTDYFLEYDSNGKTDQINAVADQLEADLNATLPKDGPTIFCITTGVDVSVIRDKILPVGVPIHFYQQDVDEWLEWANSMDETTGRAHIDAEIVDMISRNHKLIHSNVEISENVKDFLLSKINDAFQNNGNNISAIKHELDAIIANAKKVYLFQDEIALLNERIVNHLYAHKEKYNDAETQAGLVALAMYLGEQTGALKFF